MQLTSLKTSPAASQKKPISFEQHRSFRLVTQHICKAYLMTKRLSDATRQHLPPAVQQFTYDRTALSPRMVHIGVGAFFRGHQSVFTDIANDTAEIPCGVVGVSLRSFTAENQMADQDGLFSIGVFDGESEAYQIIGNVMHVITAPRNPSAAMSALIAPGVSVVTLTITEKGYGLDPASGELILDAGDIADDLSHPENPTTAIGYVTEALRRRRASGAGAFAAMSCDNLPSNGARLKSAVLQYAKQLDSSLVEWIEANATFPESMVDRIVPATTSGDLEEAESALGLRDDAYVKTEPFLQWVIQDDFKGYRPEWEKAGAMIVPDVAPYENAKLRLLNGAHSSIAYLGYLSGHSFVHEVMADKALSSFITKLMDEEIASTLDEPNGMPLSAYAEQLRSRFRNSSLQHRTWQIAMDGSQKLPQRLLNTIRDRIAANKPFPLLATAVAGWIVYACGKMPSGDTIDVRDPMSEKFEEIAQAANGDITSQLNGFLSLSDVFGTDLPVSAVFRDNVRAALEDIYAKGCRVTCLEATLNHFLDTA